MSPTADYLAEAARLGGSRAPVVLYALSVSYPANRTFVLAEHAWPADALYPGSPAAWGLVREAGPAGAETGGEGGVTLALVDVDGTGGLGPGRRFSDWFASPVEGYADPYDLTGALLVITAGWAGLAEADALPYGRYRILADSITRDADTLRLNFGPDRARHRLLPRRRVTESLWPQAPLDARNAPIPVPFGRDRVIPAVPVDPAVGLYLGCESPSDTPVHTLHHVLIGGEDPETGARHYHPIAIDLPNPVVAFTPADVDSTTVSLGGSVLRDVAEGVIFPASGLVSAFRVKLGNGPGAGRMICRVFRDATGTPGDELVEPLAVSEFNAALVSSEAIHTFTFRPPFFVRGGERVWFAVSYAKTGGANITIRVSTGKVAGQGNVDFYPDGYYAEKLTTDSTWLRPRRITSRVVMTDGIIFNADACLASIEAPDVAVIRDPDVEVPPFPVRRLSYLGPPGLRGLIAGTDFRCRRSITARSVLRFRIDDLAAAPTLVELRLVMIRTRTPTTPLKLVRIADFADFATVPYDSPTLADFGAIASPGVAVPSTVLVDVTAAYAAAKAAPATHLACRLRTTQEFATTSGSWYAVAAREGPSGQAPRLLVHEEATADRRDLWFEADFLPATLDAATVDAAGESVATVTFGVDLGEQRLVAIALDGLADDGGGTYTGTPGALITNGADLVRWLARHPLGLGLAAEAVDGDALDAARERLADWIRLAGVVWEELPSETWLSRVTACARSLWYEDQAGRLTLWTEGGAPSAPVLRVRPWEYGTLEMAALGRLAGSLPWSRVDVFYGRDLLARENVPSSRSQHPEWDGYATIGAGRTDPPDTVRSLAAEIREARFGLRTNSVGSEGIPGDDNTFYFLPEETLDEHAGKRLLDWLWDRSGERLDPFGLITVALPRVALGLRLMDEVTLEAYPFPWRGARAAPGLLTLEGGLEGGPLYGARRGRFSVRALDTRAASGTDWPVRATLRLIGWET